MIFMRLIVSNKKLKVSRKQPGNQPLIYMQNRCKRPMNGIFLDIQANSAQNLHNQLIQAKIWKLNL